MYGNEEESIYDSSIGFLGEGSSLVAPEVAKKVAVYFKRALSRSPERMDIQLGLCWVYANAGLKNELVARFPELKKHSGDKEGLQYNMGDYARIILENYSFDDGIFVYRAITKLYPRDGNIINDMAALYFQQGDLDTALKYFTQAASMSQRDEMTLANLVLINAVVGNYDKSVQYQKQVSEMKKDDTYLLYRALYQRLTGDPGWQEELKVFINNNQDKENSKPYTDMARSLLPVSGQYGYKQYESSVNHKVETHFDIVNFDWATKQFPDKFGPTFDLADMYTFYQNYRKAIPLYERIEKENLTRTRDEREKLDFYHAWALYRAGSVDEANRRWLRLLDAEDFYRKSAACYFLGNYHYQRKEYEKASDYFKRVKDDASKSKYANFANNLYGQIRDRN